MNRYIFFGIPFLYFGEFLVLDNNTITSSNPTTTVNIFSQKTQQSYYDRSNSFNLFDIDHLSLNFIVYL
jgi:hypothetical protein